jgi:hypothetical protein
MIASALGCQVPRSGVDDEKEKRVSQSEKFVAVKKVAQRATRSSTFDLENYKLEPKNHLIHESNNIPIFDEGQNTSEYNVDPQITSEEKSQC